MVKKIILAILSVIAVLGLVFTLRTCSLEKRVLSEQRIESERPVGLQR